MYPLSLLLILETLLRGPILSLMISPIFLIFEPLLFPLSCFRHHSGHVVIHIPLSAIVSPISRATPINHELRSGVLHFIVSTSELLPWGPLPLFLRLVLFVTFIHLLIITLFSVLIPEP
ncbi:hypothetical protein Hanom_Chr15g01392881 [Helianthus anomalus]